MVPTKTSASILKLEAVSTGLKRPMKTKYMLKSATNQQADMGAIIPVVHADFRKQKKKKEPYSLS